MANQVQEANPEEKMYPDIDMSIVIQEFETASTNTKNYTSDFPALDNLVDGIPVTHENGAPYVGDTTIAGLVRQVPRLCLQQVPIFAAVLNGTKKSINALVASYLLRSAVFNEDTFGKGVLSTMQIGAEQALTHGYAPFMTSTGTMYDEFGTTMKLMHYADCAPEPGIQDASEAGYFYVVANIPKSRLRKIIRSAERNPKTTWNVKKLKELYETPPQINNYSIYQSDAKKDKGGQNAVTYTLVTRYEVGKDGEFVTFCPQIQDEPLRVLENRSKFGYPRIQFLVIDPAALSPFGSSRVRLASPNQNLMNAYYQNVASMLILNSKPPVLKRGRFTKPVQLKQGAVWETLDQNAKAELVELSNGSLQTFVPMAQQFAAQIMNIFGMPTGQVNGGTNAMGFSKTAPGVAMQTKAQDTSTNQITNILENFLRQYALVALDTLLCEQTVDEEELTDEEGNEVPNEDTLILDDEAKDAINRVGQETFVPSEEQSVYVPIVGEDNEYVINWNDFYKFIKKMSVTIELSIGKDEMDEKKRGDIQDTLTVLMQNADPNDQETQGKIRELQDRLLEKSVPESSRLKQSTAPKPEEPPVTTEVSPQVSITQ